MKNLNEFLIENITPLPDYLYNDLRGGDQIIDESLRDLWNMAKKMFSKLWQYGKSIVTKIDSYILSVGMNPQTGEAELLPAITPPTSAAAFMDKLINAGTTMVFADRESRKITGLNTKIDNLFKIYNSDELDPEKYFYMFAKNLNSLNESEFKNSLGMINEVKLKHEGTETYSVITDNDVLKDIIMDNIASQMNYNGARLLIWGAPGVGKTAIMQEVVNAIKSELGNDNYNMIVKTLSNETPDNFTLPAYNIDKTKAIDIPKTWLPVYPVDDPREDELNEMCGHGLLFIDELSRATQQVLNVILPLINEGMFNGYKLGSGWSIICASNRIEDEETGQSALGNALSNRFAQVYYEPVPKTWAEWATKQNFISPLFTHWLSISDKSNTTGGGKYFYWDPNEENQDSMYPSTLVASPRSWTNAMMELARWEYFFENKNVNRFSVNKQNLNLKECKILDIFNSDPNKFALILTKYVPKKAADAFMGFLDTCNKCGNVEQISESIWSDGGSALMTKNTSILDVYLPIIIQCAVEYKKNDNRLPDKDEFKSLCQFIISLDNAQYIQLILNEFFNAFLFDPRESDNKFLNASVLVLSSLKTKSNFNPEYYQSILDKWNLKSIDDIPDYSIGFKLLVNKVNTDPKFKEVLTLNLGDTNEKIFDII